MPSALTCCNTCSFSATRFVVFRTLRSASEHEKQIFRARRFTFRDDSAVGRARDRVTFQREMKFRVAVEGIPAK